MINKNIRIRKMADYDRDVYNEVASVFVDAYYKDLHNLTKNKEKLKNAFKNTFCPDIFFLAELEGKIVGMLACANNLKRAMHIEKASMKKHLGFIVGTLAYYFLRNQFNAPLTYPDETGYIECVATIEKARGKGVGTALLQHVMHELPYRQLILEVVDTNQTAYQLYKKVGFSELQRKPVKYPKLKGFREKIYMSWSK